MAGGHDPAGWTFGELRPDYAAEWERSGQSFAVLAGIEWKILLDAYEAGCRHVPAKTRMELRYEDFIRAPRDHLREILAFAGLEWSRSLDRALALERIHVDRSDAYVNELSSVDVERLNSTLAAHLDRYGYGVGG